MKRLRFFLCALGLLLARGFLSAATVLEIQEKMLRSQEQIRTLRFEYVQVLHSALTAQLQESRGTAAIQNPNRLRIEQTAPEKQLMVANGKTVQVYTPRFGQVLVQRWEKWFAANFMFPGISGFADSLLKLKSEYQWELLGESSFQNARVWEVQLKKDKSPDQSIKIFIDQNDLIPRKTEVYSGTLTFTTTLTDLVLNQDIAPELFVFKKPKDVKEIIVHE